MIKSKVLDLIENLRWNVVFYHEVKCMRKKLIRRNVVLAILAAGILYMPAMAEGGSTPHISVRDPNQTITGDISFDGADPIAIAVFKSASGGEIHIDSKNITVSGTAKKADGIGIITLEEGYTGHVKTADGMRLQGTFSGISPRAVGIYLHGGGANTGKPAGGVLSIGNDTTIRMANESGDRQLAAKVIVRGMDVIGQTVNAGDRLNIGVKANTNTNGGTKGTAANALQIDDYGSVSIGDHARFSVENHIKVDEVKGFNITSGIESVLSPTGETPKGKNQLTLGKDAAIGVTFTSDSGTASNAYVYGLRLQDTEATVGEGAGIVLQGSGSANSLYGTYVKDSRVSFKDDLKLRISMNGNTGPIYGHTAANKATLNVGNAAVTEITGNGNTNKLYGYAALSNATLNVGNAAVTEIRGSGQAGNVVGVYASGGSASFEDNMRTGISFDGFAKTIVGLYAGSNSTFKIGNDSSTEIRGNGNHFQNNTAKGIYNSKGDMQIGARANVMMDIHNTQKPADNSSAVGVQSGGGQLIAGDHLQVQVDASGYLTARGLSATDSGKVTVGDEASVLVHSEDATTNHVLHAESGGTITFAGAASIQGDREAAWSEGDASCISLTGSGKKTILGNLVSKDKGRIVLDLATSDSLLRGKSSVLDASDKENVEAADTELRLSGGALWHMTDSSTVTKLTNRGGAVNMAYHPDYDTLHIGTFGGKDGVFVMNSDFASQTYGDKVTIDDAEEGSSGDISVYDKSLATGHKVTGTKHLLMVTDESKKATFTGRDLDTGGLWELTPTIREGGTFTDADDNVVGSSGEWYLTNLTKKINKETESLIESGETNYGLYRLSIDTLRQRLGDLRYRKHSEDTFDFWTRNRGGHYEGKGYDSKYNFFQVGMDTMPNEKSAYGFLVERGIASQGFLMGSGKNHTLSGAFYATWLGDHGSHTDVVAKVGRNDTTFHSYGAFADSASYRENQQSLSVEYGRSVALGSDGYFIEPQVQLVLGHLGSNSYTTSRGTHVKEDGFDSAIGRLGFVFGKKQAEGENPHDFYLKASVLHEFGGDRDYSLRRLNAYGDEETLDGSYSYGDTWFEVGFGGNVKINQSTYFYADVERSFGGDYTKKWQFNAGIHWSF